jgi:subtilisin family serine protease
VVAAANDNADLDHDGNDYRCTAPRPRRSASRPRGPRAARSWGPWVNPDARAPRQLRPLGHRRRGAGGAFIPVTGVCSSSSLQLPQCRQQISVITGVGTSLAAPPVAGAAALVVEEVGRNPARVRARLEQTADDLGQPGTDPYFGRGRINLPRALGLP